MTKKVDVDFIRRVVLTLLTAVEDHNWEDVEIATGVLAKELGVKVPAALEAKMTRAFAEQDA